VKIILFGVNAKICTPLKTFEEKSLSAIPSLHLCFQREP